MSTAIRSRRSFIGGSDARIIMGEDEAALLRLWREKRGEVEPEDLSDNLVVQLGSVTEDLNRHWYERNTSQMVTDVQRQVRHPVNRWMGATLDGMVAGTGAVFEAKFMLPWSFSEEAAAEQAHGAAAAQHVGHQCPGGGALDHHRRRQVGRDHHSGRRLYQHLLITAERKFWRCVETGEPPRLFLVEPPRAAHRGGAGGRHEHLELLGGVCRDLSAQHGRRSSSMSAPRSSSKP